MYYVSELCTPRGTKETFYGSEMTISLDDLPPYTFEKLVKIVVQLCLALSMP